MAIKIRNAELNDAASISRLMDQLGYEASAAFIASKLEAFLPRDYDAVFVAVDEGKILGCISCHITSVFHKEGASGRITSLVIDSSYRGRGVGKALVEAADKYFIESGCIQAEVTSGDHRPEAHKFYQNNGYALDERRFIKRYL